MAIIKANVATAKDIIRRAVPAITGTRACKCATAMKYATVTDPKTIPAKTRQDLDLLLGKYL